MSHMSHESAERQKLSKPLASRLEQLGSAQTTRLIVLLSLPTGPDQPDGRASRRAMRAATVEAVRSASQPGLAEVDRILSEHGGRRLHGDVTALGAIAVETTADGARALSKSEHVRAILEDQPMHGILAHGA